MADDARGERRQKTIARKATIANAKQGETKRKRQRKRKSGPKLTPVQVAELNAKREEMRIEAETKNKARRIAAEKQFGCTPRQARKKLRLGKSWTADDMSKASLDNDARSMPSKRRNSAGARGPVKGPAKREPKMSREAWVRLMTT